MPNWPMSRRARRRIFLRLAAFAVEKGARAGIGDGAERADQIVVRHADAIVGDRQRLRVLVERDGDERRAVGGERRIGERLVAQLFAGVGGVGDQLAQENVALRIDGMDHQIQKLRDIGLESMRFGLRRFR